MTASIDGWRKASTPRTDEWFPSSALLFGCSEPLFRKSFPVFDHAVPIFGGMVWKTGPSGRLSGRSGSKFDCSERIFSLSKSKIGCFVSISAGTGSKTADSTATFVSSTPPKLPMFLDSSDLHCMAPQGGGRLPAWPCSGRQRPAGGKGEPVPMLDHLAGDAGEASGRMPDATRQSRWKRAATLALRPPAARGFSRLLAVRPPISSLEKPALAPAAARCHPAAVMMVPLMLTPCLPDHPPAARQNNPRRTPSRQRHRGS